MIENLSELAKFVKGGEDVLQKAINSEDNVSLEFVDGRFVTDSELDSLKENVKKDAKKEGQTIGYDFAMKDLKSDFGLELEGKDRSKIVEAIKSGILAEANKKPDAKIAELNQSLENLRGEYERTVKDKDGEINTYKTKLKDISIMSELQRNIPEINGIKNNHFATLVKTEYDFDFDESGQMVVKKNGNTLKDKMEKPIPVKDVLTDFATQNGWTSTSGRGGGNQTGGSSEFKSLHDVYKHMEQNNIDPMSKAGQELVNDFETKNN